MARHSTTRHSGRQPCDGRNTGETQRNASRPQGVHRSLCKSERGILNLMMKMLKWWRGRYIDRQIEGGEKKKGTDRTLGWMGLLSPDKQVTCHGEQQETMELRDVKSQNGFRARVQQTLDVNKDTPGSEIQTASFASNRKGYFWGEEREREVD